MSYVNTHDQHEQESPTVVVDARNQGDYTTITDALKAVKAGARILVQPGLYKESIVIDKPVEIIGDGNRNDIVIEASGKVTVLFKANNGKVINLTLRQTKGDGWYCVNIIQGSLELEDCDITSQGLACVVIRSCAATRLRRNRIHDAHVGVVVDLDGYGTLEDNEIFANAEHGVMILIESDATLRRNRIFQNSKVGISVTHGGGGIFEDNDLRGNTKGAWFITPDCEARVQRRGNIE